MVVKRIAEMQVEELERLLRSVQRSAPCAPLLYGSFFSGLDAGAIALENMGVEFETVFAVDHKTQQMLRQNHHIHKVHGDIRGLNFKKELSAVDLFQCSPACQGYSAAGLQNGDSHVEGDLAKFGARYVAMFLPKAFAFEQVPAFPRDFPKEAARLRRSLSKGKRYELAEYLLTCSTHGGLPQVRTRWFLIGILKSELDRHLPEILLPVPAIPISELLEQGLEEEIPSDTIYTLRLSQNHSFFPPRLQSAIFKPLTTFHT